AGPGVRRHPGGVGRLAARVFQRPPRGRRENSASHLSTRRSRVSGDLVGSWEVLASSNSEKVQGHARNTLPAPYGRRDNPSLQPLPKAERGWRRTSNALPPHRAEGAEGRFFSHR